MKTNRYIFVLALLLISTAAFSQVPRMLNHQGYLTNSSGVALDTTMAMTFRLFPDSSGGSAVWNQTIDTVTFTKGVFSVNLGPIDAAFDQQYWLEVEAGGEIINPRTRLTSAAYAMRSSFADNLNPATDLNINSIQTSGTAKFTNLLELEGPDGYFRAHANYGKSNGTTLLGGFYAKNGSGAQMRFTGVTENYIDIGQNEQGNFVVESNDNNIMTLNTYGRMGLGTINPNYNMHIVGNNPTLALEESGTSNANFLFMRQGTPKWYLLANYGSPTDNIAFYDASIGTKVLQINPGGNVGIGTTTPYYRLHVKKDYPDWAMSVENQNSGSAYGLISQATYYGGSGSRYGIEGLAYYGTSNNYGGYFYGYGGNYAYGIYAIAGGSIYGNYAGYFSGSVHVSGTLTKSAGSFKIDHPLDPANKYLSHSFVESPDMMNIYNGIATIDANGEAVVQLPAWFQALNKDYRYQLTAIGAPGPNLYISKKVDNNSFSIAGGKQGMEVSWQVTGIRKDVYAEKHRIPVEENKTGDERGLYMMPELFGQPKETGINYLHEKQAKEQPKRDQD